ncbi:MAG: RNA polymerase sigma factor [Candidatus Saccharicenans sp.]
MDEREKELVQKVLAGESQAFEELVLPYRQSLLHLAYRMTGNMEEARDIAQETIFRCYRYLHRYDMERDFQNWLFQIAANLVRDWLRKRKAELNLGQKCKENTQPAINSDPAGIEGLALSQPSAESISNIRLDVNACLEKLSPKERRVFILRDLEGLSIKETAAVLKTSSISVRVNLSSARRKIRQLISGQEANGQPGQKLGDNNEM